MQPKINFANADKKYPIILPDLAILQPVKNEITYPN